MLPRTQSTSTPCNEVQICTNILEKKTLTESIKAFNLGILLSGPHNKNMHRKTKVSMCQAPYL